MKQDINLRTTFNTEAELYHAMRPHYPEALFKTLIIATHLPKNAKLLEIGPGTGQATISLAKRGYNITAVELGSELAEVARRELQKYKNVDIITSAFESVQLPRNTFNLVYAATAFHWIKPKVRFAKPYALLKSKGYLAIIHTHHVSDGFKDTFFHAAQPIYKKYEKNRSESVKSPMLQINDLKPGEIDEKLFKPVLHKVFPLVIKYSAEEYIKLLGTYSPNLAMKPLEQKKFFKEIKNLINRDFEGVVSKRYAMSLTIARKNN